MVTRCSSLLLVACFAAAQAHAEEMFLKSKEVTVDGVADIKTAGSEAAARELAIKNAQKNAIEQVIGTLIKSSFSAEQQETVKNNQTTFNSNVQDKIITKSEGYIESQTLVSEKKDGGTYRVTMKLTVKAASLNEELTKLQAIFKAADYPKVMLMLTERYTDKAKAARWIDRPSIVPVIEEALLKRTFELVAKDQADKLRADSLEAYAEIVGTPEKTAQIASKYGAEVAVVGSAEVTFSAFNELNDNMYYVSAVVNLRAVNASTAKIMASFEAVGKGIGVNEELARVSAIKKAGPEVVDKLVQGLVKAWEAEASHGKRFTVTFINIKNYNGQARPLMKEMKKIAKVENVKELNFGGKRLELEVIFGGSKEELLDGIFDGVATKPKFKKLNKVMDTGNNIELTL